MAIKDSLLNDINKVAMVQFSILPILNNTLKKLIINPEVRRQSGNYETYFQMWEGTLGSKFFNMATLVRLGSVIEHCLKYYYMKKKGHSNIPMLQLDPVYEQNIFQRVFPWQLKSALTIYKSELNIDLSANSHILGLQETMLHRHLYAHNSGILDQKYIDNFKRLTGQDISTQPGVSASFPNQDTYWFEPLDRINAFIESTRKVIRSLPD